MDRRTFIKLAPVALLPLLPTPGVSSTLNPEDCPVEVFEGFTKDDDALSVWSSKKFSELRKGDLFKVYMNNYKQRDLGRPDEIGFCTRSANLTKGVWSVGCDDTEDKTFYMRDGGLTVRSVRLNGVLCIRPHSG